MVLNKKHLYIALLFGVTTFTVSFLNIFNQSRVTTTITQYYLSAAPSSFVKHGDRKRTSFTTLPNPSFPGQNQSAIIPLVDKIDDEFENSEMERIFAARRQRVEDQCRIQFGQFQSSGDANDQDHLSLAEFINRDPFRFILLDERHSILYCSVPKVASTTWRRFFVELATGNNTQSLSDADFNKANATWPHLKPLAFYFANEPYATMWNRIRNYKKILWVRDPFQRILSAWRSKFLLRNDYYWPVIGRKILRRFYAKASDSAKEAGGPVPLKPFLRFLSDPSSDRDIHWEMYYRLCIPCHIGYDYIGHLEGGDAEANYVITRLTHQHDILLSSRSRSATAEKLQHQTTSQLGEVSKGLLHKVLNIYAIDYEIFDYKRPKF